MTDCRMFRALYEYKSKQPQYLSFSAGDKFTILNRKHEQWLLAQNGIGDIGYIPYNYIKQVEATNEELVKFIDGSIQAIHHYAEAQDGKCTKQQRYNLEKLVKHRESVLEEITKQQQKPKENPTSPSRRRAPPPPQPTSQNEPPQPDHKHSKKRSPPPPPLLRQSTVEAPAQTPETKHALNHCLEEQHPPLQKEKVLEDQVAPAPSKSESTFSDKATSPLREGGGSLSELEFLKNSVSIPEDLGGRLLEEVRVNTGLSHSKSRVAVETVLGFVGFNVPLVADVMDQICLTLKNELDASCVEDGSHDAERLRVIISELAYCKDDSQQRSWALHEDEAIITEYLEELLSILENAKPSVCRRMFSEDSYQPVQNLVLYYQMETRMKIRLLLLKVFGALCGLDRGIITHLLFSVLPLELAREIKENSDDLSRLCYVTLVMTMIFSSGEAVPANLHDHLDETFVNAVLELIEAPPTHGHEEEAGDLLVSLLLAFNLHLHQESDELTIVMQCLACRATAKVFTEKILLLMNRGEDPVRMFEHKPIPPNSVVKLIQDLYRHKDTAQLLYTNDAIVLVDIILRQLANLQPGDPVRSSHLQLVQLMLKSSDYFEHQHRLPDLSSFLQTIQEEESDCMEDKAMAAQILKDHNQFL